MTRTIQWQLNQNGTHFADWNGHRVAVRRVYPRKPEFKAVHDGVQIGVYPDMGSAQQAAWEHVSKLPRR